MKSKLLYKMPQFDILIAWMIVQTLLCVETAETDKSCLQKTKKFTDEYFFTFHEYKEETQELLINLTSFDSEFIDCMDEIYPNMTYHLELVADHDLERKDKCCNHLCPKMNIQDSILYTPNMTETSFQYVEGNYMFRVRECAGNSCRINRCSEVDKFGEEDIFPILESCLNNNSLAVIMEGVGTQVEQNILYRNKQCYFQFQTIVPMCTKIHPYSVANVSVIKIPLNGTCPEELDPWSLEDHPIIVNSAHEPIKFCNSSWCQERTSQYNITNNGQFGFVHHSVTVEPNSSYCLWLNILNPHCSQTVGNDCNFILSHPASCHWEDVENHPLFSRDPIFISVVCGILIVSLALLMWTVVHCKKDQHSEHSSPENLIKKTSLVASKMSKSLTEDDMAHISSLHSQELVLVYFPDTNKFKNLNRKFRDWLISLSVLNVQDVTDVYDEKYSEGPDGIMSNPEGWVANLLGDPERRVILVTSKLAYECLVHLRRGMSPPKFPENDPYSDLLIHMLRFIDSEMFKGNYRRLICVRYEDLKICDRRFGSESFNIVPGTEYLLPQHLEDVARWIHPIEAKPGLWAEHRPQVKNLLESIKAYRNHEDNIFTVQFYSGGHTVCGGGGDSNGVSNGY